MGELLALEAGRVFLAFMVAGTALMVAAACFPLGPFSWRRAHMAMGLLVGGAVLNIAGIAWAAATL